MVVGVGKVKKYQNPICRIIAFATKQMYLKWRNVGVGFRLESLSSLVELESENVHMTLAMRK
jgi:hypothetical protein